MPELPSLDELMSAAVSGVGGVPRPGQAKMAQAVEHAIETGEHLLVQAGTGTGKSLAYLVPAIRHAFDVNKPAVVATATLALQAQIVDRDKADSTVSSFMSAADGVVTLDTSDLTFQQSVEAVLTLVERARG
mgnify:CR=1 FL=1